MPYIGSDGKEKMTAREYRAKYDQEMLLRHMASELQEHRRLNPKPRTAGDEMNSKTSAAIIWTIITVVLFVVNPILSLLVIIPYACVRVIKSRKASKPRRDAERAAIKQEREDKAKGITRDMFGSIVTEETEAERKERTELFGNFSG